MQQMPSPALGNRPFELEVCATSLEDALAAERGGAHRIELCSHLELDGLTPSLEDFEQIRQLIQLEIFPMIRLRCGSFSYTEEEIAIMIESIKILRSAGADGFVFGCLTPQGCYDQEGNARLLEASGGLPCTFHRAIDTVTDPIHLVTPIIEAGFCRILSSGGAINAVEGIEILKHMVQIAGKQIKIQCGGGLSANNVVQLAQATGATCFHGTFRRKAEGELTANPSEIERARRALEETFAVRYL